MKKIFLLMINSICMGWTHIGSNIYGWNLKEISFKVNPENCTVDEVTLNRIVDSSLAAWNAAATANVKLVRGTTTTTAESLLAGSATDTPIIVCDPNFSVGDPNNIPGVMPGARVGSDGYIQYAGVVLNSRSGYAADIGGLDQGEVSVTLAHEIGHVLGLGHSGDSTALMYFSILQPTAIVTDDDIAGLTHLYPRNEISGGGAYGCASAKNTTKQATLWDFVTAFMIFVGVPVVAIALARFRLVPLRLLRERLP